MPDGEGGRGRASGGNSRNPDIETTRSGVCLMNWIANNGGTCRHHSVLYTHSGNPNGCPSRQVR